MPAHIRADRHPGLSSVGLRLPSSACPWPGLGGGTRIALVMTGQHEPALVQFARQVIVVDANSPRKREQEERETASRRGK